MTNLQAKQAPKPAKAHGIGHNDAHDDGFSDLHPAYSSLQAMAESNRCLYCYDAPCVTACPTSIDIPSFIRKISTGNPDGAAKTILSANIMGGTCARACPTEVLCEQACVRNVAEDTAVEIGSLQRFAVDHLMDRDLPHPFKRAEATGKKIAVVGAGPAGLSCAHRAAMLGHDVTVFEAKAKPGGLNEYGLAAYKMTNDFAQREVEFLLGIGGIRIEYGKALGRDISIASLKESHDAVFVGVGLGSTNNLGLKGEEFPGVDDAITFIEQLRQTEPKSEMPVGDNVIVIGGGNTAIDAAVQAKRLGASEVTLVYRRGPENMSATEFEQDLAKTNGVVVRYWAKPVAIKTNGKLQGMSFEKTALDDSGKLVGTGETFDVHADQILKAIGQKIKTDDLAGMEITGGKIIVDDTYQTTAPGVFAGGDCIKSGEDLTVQSVEDGKQAAIAIDAFLKTATA
ncbi:NAD(P)-dependent oxidoreductase [Thalassospira lucentensis]|uniref:NAD(P)-dependent oxidoreductase n=1 Tax=Thalassospira lucentensis TaxID=168935 RepID=UPI00142E4EEF|nr:NAD(P)-dependent oxidoreductase [Thalassospira lucentensis]NIZ01119.1 NAD(P)-dependent oxidoreductase [Thalassospira lucentensis]